MRTAVLAVLFITGCGYNQAYIENQYAKMSNQQLVNNYSALKQMRAELVLGVTKPHVIAEKAAEAEMRRRGIQGTGLPPIINPPSESISF